MHRAAGATEALDPMDLSAEKYGVLFDNLQGVK